jgi:hypothetical protein
MDSTRRRLRAVHLAKCVGDRFVYLQPNEISVGSATMPFDKTAVFANLGLSKI